MTKSEYLADTSVRQMMDWLRARMNDGGNFVHRYTDRKTRKPWACDGLHDAFRQYNWNEKNWAANKAELDVFRARLRTAVAAHDEAALFDACQDVLEWGGVLRGGNRVYLGLRRASLQDEIACLAKTLSADREPTKTEIRRNPNDRDTSCRMNAGFVKIYSVLFDHFVIYDGRVGAALGFLVRLFCEESGRREVPLPLAFAYGNPNEGHNANRKQRNPSMGAYQFPRLATNGHVHCVQAMRASWLLRETLAANTTPFSAGEDGFHEVAAGLFMVGYDLGEEQPM